uniref:C-type lectin domain-containing protein n=1 Tax=Panagrolaimus sp. ES5 TaxID=591445 RepID=A0AC34FEH8_9BILA
MYTLFLFSIFLNSLIYTTASCPGDNSSQWQSQCFTFFNTSKTFSDAETTCIQNGGHLVSIHDGFTNAFIAQEAPKYIKNETDFWIGATKNNGTNWSWTDGSTLDFIDWKKGEPNNSSKNSCATFSISNGYWSSQKCADKKAFVCASANMNGTTSTVPASPTPSASSSPCEEGWKYFAPSKACYHLYNQSEVETWQPAENICISQNSHLASLHSQDEAMFLLSYEEQLGYALWIGLTTDDKGMTWKWSDGTPTDYMPWRQGFPYPYFDYDTCGLLMIESDDNEVPRE